MFDRPVILGASGQLGVALQRRFAARGVGAIACGLDRLDLTAPDAAQQLLDLKPTSVFNAAAWTDVRGAELAENRERVWEINCHAPARIAAACGDAAIPFVHVSTDYVFDGAATDPYPEDAPARPLQAYGVSKWEGELAVANAYPQAIIARTSTVYGDRPDGPPHYVDAILKQARQKSRIEVVELPISSPSYTPDIAQGLIRLAEVGANGCVHVVNRGAASRYELAQAAVRHAALDCEVALREAPADDLQRPDYSVLATDRYSALTGETMRDWDAALQEYVGGLTA